ERNDKQGAKILISGGGRCNYTNLGTTIDNFVSENPKFLHAVFSQWSVDDTIQFFDDFVGINPHEKTLGQMFPTTNKAKDIVATFTKLMYETGQDLWLNTLVTAVQKVENGYELLIKRNEKEEKLFARKIVF